MNQPYAVYQSNLGALSAGKGKTTSKMGGAFIETLYEQMSNWIQALNDSKISKAEASAISNNNYGSYLNAVETQGLNSEGLLEGDELLYNEAAANLFVNLQLSHIVNLSTIFTNFENKKTELYNLANSIIKGA